MTTINRTRVHKCNLVFKIFQFHVVEAAENGVNSLYFYQALAHLQLLNTTAKPLKKSSYHAGTLNAYLISFFLP